MGRKPVHLVFVENSSKGDGKDHNKFYDMYEENGMCCCRYGRIQDKHVFGESGKLVTYPLSQWDKQYNEKVAKGYKDKTFLLEENISAVKEVDSDGDVYAPIENKNIKVLVERLQKLANDTINENYKINSKDVTRAMIDEGQRLIDELTYIFNSAKITENKKKIFVLDMFNLYRFNDILEELFATIPRSMRKVSMYLISEDNPEYIYFKKNPKKFIENMIQKEQDLLDIMRGQIITPVRGQKVKTVKGDKKTILEINGIKIEEASPQDIAEVQRKLGSNAHRLINVWKIENEKQTKAFEKYRMEEGIPLRACKKLFHGTRSENVWSILKTGLVLRPTNAVLTGSMFGRGIYFAPSSSKSLGYTSLSGSYWAKGHAKTGFMILHSVAYGKPYVVDSFDSKYYNFDYRALRKACPGAHCLHADSSKGMLRNDEIVVYKEEQIMPLYLIEIG